MKQISLILLQLLIALVISGQDTPDGQERPLNIIVFGAHPDDCDADAGGTAILFSQLGHHVKFVSMTNGDAGHYAMGGGALARIRHEEAMEAGRRFGVEYEVLDNHDGELMPTLENRKKMIRLIREWNADIVIGPRPNDYHPDHRYTAILMQDAAFMVIVPNIVPDVPPLKRNPVFLFAEDHFQKPNPFEPDIAVDIEPVFDQKIYAMAAHESQYFDWLPWTRRVLDQVPEDEDSRLEMLAGRRSNAPDMAVKACLIKWYGEKGSQIEHAEAFEICEYGRQPDDEEILQLFPMLTAQVAEE